MPTNKQKDLALLKKVMKAAGDVSQTIVGDRLGKTQSAISHCFRGRSELSPLERRELKHWLAELAAEEEARAGRVTVATRPLHDTPMQPLAFFEHLKGCDLCLQRAYETRLRATPS